MRKDEFYIGWQDKEPEGYKKTFLWFFGGAFVIMLIVAMVFVKVEKGFIDSYFDFGNLTEMRGRLVLDPVPALLTMEDGKRKTVPLVGFGKFGADPVLGRFQEKVSGSLSDYEVVLRGTVFSYQDKVWMELTEGDESIVSHKPAGSIERAVAEVGPMVFEGEIVDPKCFFGVMNPADKAVHRSCAIRCISGGVPPVLGLRRDGEFVDYYLLTDSDLQMINQQVLPYVGLPVSLSGTVVVYDDWKVLKVEPGNLQISVIAEPTARLTFCQP